MKDIGPLRHHAVVVDDLEVARTFYRHLGFTTAVYEGSPDSDFIQRLSGGAWVGVDILKLANVNGDILEFLCPSSRKGVPVLTDGGWTHFAISVGDCHQAWLELIERGAKSVGGPITDPDAPFRVAYLRDPWGNLIEIVEPLMPAEGG